ncbi:Transcriptional regulator of ribosomal biogenesis protein [Dissophora globulifera]|nr:Transcriptional regulator of ribosomal biogenesis protein [Dissophora globulifera]
MHALLQHYEEAHVRFEEDDLEDDDLLVNAGFTDDDGWSTHSESLPSSPQMRASRHLDSAFGGSASSSAANAAAAATVAALTAACVKNGSLSFVGAKKKSNGVSLSDIYSDSAFIPDEAASAFPTSILKTNMTAMMATGLAHPVTTHASKKRDLAALSSSFDQQTPISKRTSLHPRIFSTNAAAAAALTAASLMGDMQPSSRIALTESNAAPVTLGPQDELMSTVTGYLEQAIQRGLLPNCGEVGSPAYLQAVDELLRKRDEIVSMMESIGRPGSSGADKPYRCSVSGCDKAYKNPNGLKYHNQHGHCSVPGSGDDDKANVKPYRCTFMDCGKCYKNLNGLKYHIEHSHPNLAAALYANIPGLANLEGGNASQAAITAAAAIAAVKGDPTMMSAINAIIASAANNGIRPSVVATRDNTPDSSPNASPVLGPIRTTSISQLSTLRSAAENPFSTDVTPMTSPLLGRAMLVPTTPLSIQTTIGGSSKDGPIKLAGLMTPSSLSPTLTMAPRSPNGSQVSTLTAALAAVAVEQQRAY